MGFRDLPVALFLQVRRRAATLWAGVRSTTPGQYWTSALALLVALPVLFFGLPPTTTLVQTGLDPAADSPNPPTAGPSTDAPTDRGILVGPPRSVAGPGFGSVAEPTDPDVDPTAVTDPPPAADGAGPVPRPAPGEPCPAAETVESTLEALSGVEVVPRKSVVALIGGLAGCSEIDPTIFPIALLAEIGSGLPDPGLEVPLPTVPFVEIPPAAVDLAQPLRDAIEPLCETAALGSPLILIGLSTWPTNVDQVLLLPVSQVLLVCGQLLAPEATDGAAPAWSWACMCWQNQ
jgi:hypothetical protein